jgi:hypothetical protein
MAQMPDPFPSLLARIKRIEDRLNQRLASSPFFGTGFHPNGHGGMDSDNFDSTHGFSFKGDTGDAEFNGNVDVGGTQNVGGTLHVTGNTVIDGTLSLPAGIIDNDALATPVVVGQAFQATSGFSLSVAGAYIITINQATPAGFTKVVVTAFGRVLGQNSTASGDSLYTDIDVNGAGGNQFPTGVGAGTGNTSSVGFTTTVTGLTTGATVSTKLFASTGAAGWAASGANAADLSVTYSWSR